MADNYNSMQANLGLIPGGGPQMQVKSPAQAAAELSQQASMQMQQAQAMMPVARTSAASFTFGQQYQQQFQAAQAQSNLNPYAANMFGAFTQPSALPSPAMMTPASTGVFRPPMPYGSGAGGTPMSPMAVMPMFQTPFTPQMPPPNFRTPWEQEIQQRELRADQIYATASQAPRFGGMAAGYGMGALAGAAVGGRFGAVGRGVGAVLGGLMSHYSGFAEGMGEMSMAPFRPGREAHEMGLAAQRMSQDWVVGGPNLHSLGRGLSRDASMYVGQGVQRLAESQSFKNETGGMFNRQDLMQILQKSGQAGLMDMDQGVGQIQEQLRRVSRTVSRFMELTNDPDVTSVIKRMGQLRTFGLSMPEIENAASSMRSFSRAAGTTVSGLYQQGLPGAMTYQGLGLSGGAGLQYGMYSAAAARQAVATGTYSPAELAMFGGVQGVAQRNMQAQGAFMSMPMFGAAISSYGAGGWGMNTGSLANMAGGGMGPQGMVTGAVSSMNAAVGAGGIGALAMMPLQQKRIMDQAARSLTPYEQTAMRFSMASTTGKFLGLSGAGGFAAGARMLYGDEVATQMMTEAANPAFWRAQKRMIARERDDIARSQRQDIMDAAPGFFRQLSDSIDVSPLKGVKEAGSRMGAGISRFFRDVVTRPLREYADRAEGITTYDQLDPGLEADLSTAEGRAAFKSKSDFGAKYGRQADRKSSGKATMTGRQAYDAFWRSTYGDAGAPGSEAGLAVAGFLAEGLIGARVKGLIPAQVGLALGGINTNDMLKTGLGNVMLAFQDKEGQALMQTVEQRDARMSALFGEAATRNTASSGKVFESLEQRFGLKAGRGMWTLLGAGKNVAREAGAQSHFYGDGALTESSIVKSLAASIAMQKGGSTTTADVEAQISRLSPEEYKTFVGAAMANGRDVSTATERDVYRKSNEQYRGGVQRSALTASRDEIEAIKNDLSKTEESWGLTSSSGKDELRKLVAGGRGAGELLAIMYSKERGNLSSKEQRRWEDRIAEVTGGEMQLAPTDAKVQAKIETYMKDSSGLEMSKDVQTALTSIIKSDTGFVDFATYVGAGVGGLQRSQMGVSAIAGINEALQGSTVLKTGEDLFGLSEDEMRTLAGNAKYGKIGQRLLERRDAVGADATSKLTSAVEQEFALAGDLAGESESMFSGWGDKIAALFASDAKMSEVAEKMSEAFKDFTPETTRAFRDGALALQEALITGNRNSGMP